MTRRYLVLVVLAGLSCSNSTSPGAPPARNASASTAPAAEKPDLPQLDAEPRERALAKSIKMLLEEEHLRKISIDDELSKKAFAEYIDKLDPGKLFLLASHVKELGYYDDKMDDQLRSGDMELGRVGAALLKSRRQVVAKIVEERLATPFDFSKAETLETDPDKRTYVSSDEELADVWRKMLKLQVLERVARMEEVAKALSDASKDSEEAKQAAASLGEIPKTFEAREKKAREDIAKSYAGRFSRLEKLEPLEPSETFVNAIASVFDPHTRYLAPAAKDNFDIQMSGSLEGIGAVLTEDDHYIEVREIVPGGASWRQGQLKAGDLILAVAQEGKEAVDVADMRINQVVQMIRGPKGSIVSLTVKKPDNRIEVISITRDVVEIEAAYARGAVLEGKNGAKIGYIALPSFYGNTRSSRGRTPERNAAADLQKLLVALSSKDVKGVIVDLRSNGGGLLELARAITGMLIPEGPVVQTRYPNQKSQVLTDNDPAVYFQGDVIVMVDRFSASASEIVAGALQDYGRAIVVGTGPTHGKGTVQMLVDLNRLRAQPGPPLGVLKLTIQQFFRINGESTQWRGVVPDIVLPDPVAHVEAGERFLDNAIPWTSVAALPFQRWTKPAEIQALATRSKSRVDQNEIFSKIRQRSEYLEKRRKDTLVQLERKKWQAKRDSDSKTLESIAPDMSKGPKLFKVDVVTYARAKASGKAEADRISAWKKSLARDPWVNEARHILADDLASK